MKKDHSLAVNYAIISLFQYLFAVLVLLLHARRVFPNDVLHFIQKSLFSRMAVPFFLISASFLISLRIDQNQTGLKPYLKKSIKTYLCLSLLYLPYALFYVLNSGYPVSAAPIGAFIALFYTGMCYHLWYFPAFFLGLLIVHCLRKVFDSKWTAVICLLLYLLGSVETYSAYLEHTVIVDIYQSYKAVFLTTRNGFFYAPIFVYSGQLAYQYRDSPLLQNYPVRKLLLSSLLLSAEGYLIFLNQGQDKNFFLALVPSFSLTG